MNIIQIGTNKSYDYLTTIIKSYEAAKIQKIILVEPFSYHNDSIMNCYKEYTNQLFVENIIIVPEKHHNKQEKIWYHELDSVHQNAYELASLNPQHASRIRNHYKTEDMKFNLIDCYNINELFRKYDLSHIDILAVDTEGFDDKIIYSIDFEKYNISTIFYEYLHINKYLIQKFLENKGYWVDHSITEDPYTSRAIKQ